MEAESAEAYYQPQTEPLVSTWMLAIAHPFWLFSSYSVQSFMSEENTILGRIKIAHLRIDAASLHPAS